MTPLFLTATDEFEENESEEDPQDLNHTESHAEILKRFERPVKLNMKQFSTLQYLGGFNPIVSCIV